MQTIDRFEIARNLKDYSGRVDLPEQQLGDFEGNLFSLARFAREDNNRPTVDLCALRAEVNMGRYALILQQEGMILALAEGQRLNRNDPHDVATVWLATRIDVVEEIWSTPVNRHEHEWARFLALALLIARGVDIYTLAVLCHAQGFTLDKDALIERIGEYRIGEALRGNFVLNEAWAELGHNPEMPEWAKQAAAAMRLPRSRRGGFQFPSETIDIPVSEEIPEWESALARMDMST